MRIREWSDTQIKYHVIEKTSEGETNEVDLTEYDKILMEIRYSDGIREYEWEIDTEEEENSYVLFDIFSEYTKWRAGKVRVDVRWVKDAKRIRFNRETIIWEILPSVRVPEWNVSD